LSTPWHRQRRAIGLVPLAAALFAAALATLAFAASESGAASAQTERGKTAFRLDCTHGCHMPDLGAGSYAPALAGPAFLQHWQGLSVKELYDQVRNTMPQQKPHSLSDQTYVDIVAYVIHENGVPLAAGELPADADELDSVWIKPEK
jgi:hypothetical protein